MTHHPHIHMIVPGGGISLDGSRWIASRAAFLLRTNVICKVLGKLFRRLFVSQLIALFDAKQLGFFGSNTHLNDRSAFLRHLAPARNKPWIVYAKAPFAGPEAVLNYLSRYTHRVAISNRRLVSFDANTVVFGYKDYRRDKGNQRQLMTLPTGEFIRRFLLHVLPRGLHRIRHYGLLSSGTRKTNLAFIRQLLSPQPTQPLNVQNQQPPEEPDQAADNQNKDHIPPCACCGGRIVIMTRFARWTQPRWTQPRAPPNWAATYPEQKP